MKIAVVILHFGNIAITKTCIQSLYHKEKSAFTLIVVNNTEKKLSIRDFGKKGVVINTERNLGFAAGVNAGIRKALKDKVDAVLLLNNDTVIHRPFLMPLIDVLRQKHVGIVAPAIEFVKNGKTLFDIGGKISSLFLRTSHREVSSIAKTLPDEVTYVSGCCMLIKKVVLQKIGLFDEQFFLYYEDADFCLRAKKAGFMTLVVPSVIIYHQLSKSVGTMSPLAIHHLLRSAALFGKKYAHTSWQKFAQKIFVLVQAILFFRANPKTGVVIARTLLESI